MQGRADQMSAIHCSPQLRERATSVDFMREGWFEDDYFIVFAESDIESVTALEVPSGNVVSWAVMRRRRPPAEAAEIQVEGAALNERIAFLELVHLALRMSTKVDTPA